MDQIHAGFIFPVSYVYFFNLTVHNFRTKLHHFFKEHQRYGTRR